MSDYTRYAVFFAPRKESPFAKFGAEWLGWDGDAHEERRPIDAPPDWEELTRIPRKYGFHGTLKPPFRLAERTRFSDLVRAVESIAERAAPFESPPWHVVRLGAFLALSSRDASLALADLAASAVVALEPFRAPLNDAELAKRRAVKLTVRQEQYLAQYGYPYVMEEFRFHLTLTGPVEPSRIDAVEADLQRRTAAFCMNPQPIEEICLFGEHSDGRFHVLKRFALGSLGEVHR